MLSSFDVSVASLVCRIRSDLDDEKPKHVT